MKSFKGFFSSKGLTLVELLASIVIVGIVLTTFFSFFSQSMIFSSKVEDKFSAVNIAERVLYETEQYFKTFSEIPLGELSGPQIGLDDVYYSVNDKKYYPIITISQTQEEEELDIYRVHVEIYETLDETSPLSEIFGYLKNEVGEENEESH